MNKIRKIIVGIVLAVFIIGTIISFSFDEDTGATIFIVLVVVLLITLGFAIGTTKTKKTEIDMSRFDISYTYYRSDFMPIGSIILTIISLIWLVVEKSQDVGTLNALGFLVGFGFLAFFEFMFRWWKVTKFNGFTFSFNNHGVEISKGSWSKEYPWSNYTHFATVYKARFGKWVQFIPFLSMLIHETDKHLINLYRKEEYRKNREWEPFTGNASEIPYDRIATLSTNHEQIIEYIKKHLKEEYKLRINERL